MTLKSSIASYSGDSYDNMAAYLTEDVLRVIGDIARSPQNTRIPPDILTELTEMHVLKDENGRIRLDTAAFLRDDIELITRTITPIAAELARQVIAAGTAFRNAAPEITHFLGGIIGLIQSSGAVLKQANLSVDWKSYQGKYAQSKVDFDEVCDAYDAIGPDYLNKSVIQGDRYIAVFIGPLGNSFKTHTFAINSTDIDKRYRKYLNSYLVDSYAMLVQDEIQSESLLASAETANLYHDGKWRTAVVTNDNIRRYENGIHAISDVASSFYVKQMETFATLLRSTSPGRQGVPSANMMLSLFRYVRRLISRELYNRRFFTDDIPERGTLTVFYKNDVKMIRDLLI